jgi:WD40 repeat protein
MKQELKMKHLIYIKLPVLACILVFIAATGGLAQTEEPVLVINPQGHSSTIRGLMFTPEGDRLVSLGWDKTIRVWDVESGFLLKTLRGHMDEGPEGTLYTGALSPDGRTLAVAGFLAHEQGDPYGLIRLIDIDSGKQKALLEGHTHVVFSLAFSADGKWLASGSADSAVRVWDVRKALENGGKDCEMTAVMRHKGYVYGVAFSPDGNQLVSVDGIESEDNKKGAGIIWDWRKQRIIAQLEEHNAGLKAVAWSPDGQYIVTTGMDGKILLWGSSGNFIDELDRLPHYGMTLSFSADGSKLLATASPRPDQTGSVPAHLYTIPSGDKLTSFKKHTDVVAAAAFYGNHLVATAGGNDGDIYIWEAGTGEVKAHIVGQGRGVRTAAFGKGLQVAFGQKVPEGLEKSFDFSRLSLNFEIPDTRSFSPARTSFQGKTLEPDGDYTLGIGRGITIKNDINDDGPLGCYTFTPGGGIVVGSAWSLKLYRGNGGFVREFVGHTGDVWEVLVSRDGRVLVSASSDQTLKLWNIATGELLASLFVSTGGEWVCWTPQGYYAASAGGEKFIGWHIDKGVNHTAEYYPLHNFRKKYARPRLVSRTIELGSFEKALEDFNTVVRTVDKVKPAPVTENLPPKVKWLSPVRLRQKVKSGSLPIRARITSDKEITDYKVLVNGKPAAGKSDILVLPGSTATEKTIQCDITLKEGKNRVTIYSAHGGASATSWARVVFYEDIRLKKPTLYVVSIGISNYANPDFSLRYADDDARAITRLFTVQKGLLYNDVKIKSIYNNTATHQSIIEALQWLRNNATPRDVGIVFVAAHGYNQQGDYYVLPYDGSPNQLTKTSVRWSDFVDILGNMPSRVLLFLDTCHSGSIGASTRSGGSPANNTEAIRELASDEYGVVVMAASTADEASLERSDWGHGAFTKAIIEGLELNKADLIRDGIVYTRELDTYVAERVHTLTDGKQHPTTQRSTAISRFPIFQRKAVARLNK